jgi:hypothetical protein
MEEGQTQASYGVEKFRGSNGPGRTLSLSTRQLGICHLINISARHNYAQWHSPYAIGGRLEKSNSKLGAMKSWID